MISEKRQKSKTRASFYLGNIDLEQSQHFFKMERKIGGNEDVSSRVELREDDRLGVKLKRNVTSQRLTRVQGLWDEGKDANIHFEIGPKPSRSGLLLLM